MLNFKKIHRRNGSFLTDDIRLDRIEILKVVGEDDIVNGLQFSIPSEDVRINDQWRRGSRRLGIFM